MTPTTDTTPDPAQVVGLTLTDERNGAFTGIYQRTTDGKLWFCRDVYRARVDHHRRVVQAWVNTTPGELKDLRKGAGKE